MAVPLLFYFIQISLNEMGKAKSKAFHVQIITEV
jgi:hypothetical protein